MAGYNEYSKSNNAIAAERDGRFPASRIARILGVPAAFISDCCAFASGGEWHHTSKFYNTTAYYDVAHIRAWIDGDADTVEDRGETFADALAAWRAAQKAKGEKRHEGCRVRWLEWGGTRSHPRATERVEDGCVVVDGGGKFVAITLPSGASFKKGRDTRGFEVHQGGKRLWL